MTWEPGPLKYTFQKTPPKTEKPCRTCGNTFLADKRALDCPICRDRTKGPGKERYLRSQRRSLARKKRLTAGQALEQPKRQSA